MLETLNNTLKTMQETIYCIEDQIESEIKNDFFGCDEMLVCRLKDKLKSKVLDICKLRQEIGYYYFSDAA